MFKTRLISGAILIAAALFLIITGGIVLYFTAFILSLIAAYELYRATGVKTKSSVGALMFAGYASIAFYYIVILTLPTSFYLMPVVIGLMAVMFVYVFRFPNHNAFQVMAVVFSILYCGVMLSCIYLTRMLPDGKFHVWLIFISAWGCDTCAYCAGMKFGKRKMSPVLSPKKSVEGAIGGVIGAVVIGIIYALCTHQNIGIYALICCVGALISMVGDLTASAIKRNMNIKDYGSLIPGHGGILDRFDSIIFTAPIIYFLFMILL